MFLSASVENIPDLSSLFISSVNAKGHPLCLQSICFSIPLLIWMHGDKWKAAGSIARPKAMVQLLVPKHFHELCAELQRSKHRSILPLPPPEPRAVTASMWEEGLGSSSTVTWRIKLLGAIKVCLEMRSISCWLTLGLVWGLKPW